MERAGDHEVLQFISEHLETVPHLEAMLLIWQNQSVPWTAEALASRIYVSIPESRSIIEDLAARGLLRETTSGESRAYVYEPAWDERHRMLPRIADLYRRQLVRVTKLIHSKGSSSVREFARAFQITKEQKEQ